MKIFFTLLFFVYSTLTIFAQGDYTAPRQDGKDITIYPNPATDFVSIYMTDAGNATYAISCHNIIGNPIDGIEPESVVSNGNNKEFRFRIKDWPSGHYFFTIQRSDGRRFMVKFMKR